MVGDGYRTGTGCTEALGPYGSPMQQPQGTINRAFAHQSHKSAKLAIHHVFSTSLPEPVSATDDLWL